MPPLESIPLVRPYPMMPQPTRRAIKPTTRTAHSSAAAGADLTLLAVCYRSQRVLMALGKEGACLAGLESSSWPSPAPGPRRSPSGCSRRLRRRRRTSHRTAWAARRSSTTRCARSTWQTECSPAGHAALPGSGGPPGSQVRPGLRARPARPAHQARRERRAQLGRKGRRVTTAPSRTRSSSRRRSR